MLFLDIYDFFEKKLKFIRQIIFNIKNIILDPGIGFGKNLKHNITILKQISIFHSLGFPVMLGVSKKDLLKIYAKITTVKIELEEQFHQVFMQLMQGVQILRVHDVNEIKQAIKVFNKIFFNI